MNLKGRTDELAPLDLSDDGELAEQLTAVAEGLGLELDPGTSLPKESRGARKRVEP